MLLQLVLTTTLIIVATGQENSKQQNDKPKQNDQGKSPLVYSETQHPEFQQPNAIDLSRDLKHFYTEQQFSPELYRVSYLEPQYQSEGILPRLQPQIVLYGPGGQGQAILINPGNPPGNFLIPQGPGPNVILRNNPQSPQGPVFPVAGYPKPAHIPPIEKDAEEIPTNPAQILPLPSKAKPVPKPKNKPEKLETFNELNPSEQNGDVNKGQFPQLSPETVSLQPGSRFFVLNGDRIFSYPFEAQPQVQHELPAFRYTNVQPFPQNPPKFLQTFSQEPSQILRSQENSVPVSVPNLFKGNSFINSQQLQLQTQQLESQPELQTQQLESQPQQTERQPHQPNPDENQSALKTIQQYFRTAFPLTQPHFELYPQDPPVNQQGALTRGSPNQNLQGVKEITAKNEVVQPQIVGQFKFTPITVAGLFPFKDDFENDAVIVDASFDAPGNFDGREGSLKAEEIESTTIDQQQPAKNESEPSMAQAGPQATAIAGPGGVAGSAPKGTAIVGKGGLAVSSPQATAVAGTKNEEKKKRPVKKNAE